MGGVAGQPAREPVRDDAGDGVQLAGNAELHRLMRAWRERLDPRSVPGLSAHIARRGRLSQEELARLVGVSASWYGNLERGVTGHGYSDDLLDRVAYALQLDPDERQVLYLLAVGRPPAPIASAPRTLTRSMHQLVHAIPWPAYISDAAWDILDYNQPMADWFPHVRYVTNVMRWVFAFPEAQLQLIDWEAAWARPMLAQMRAAHARWPTNTRLTDLISEVLAASHDARQIWDEPAVYVHPDGDRRRLYVPFADEPRRVEIMALTPMRADDLRLIILQPVDDPDPTAQSTAAAAAAGPAG